MEKAEKEVRKQALKPKRRRTKNDTVPRSVGGRWIDDDWGGQNCVFFDGYHYWGVGFIGSSMKEAINMRWTPEEWEKRKKGELNESIRGSLERGKGSKITKHNKKATRPSDKRGESSRSKARKNKGVSRRKSSKLVKK